MNICIRKAQNKDVDSLLGLLYEQSAIDMDFVIDEQKQRSLFQLLLADKWDRVLLVAEANREVAGMAIARIIALAPMGDCTIQLENVYVREDFRWKGIGMALMRQIKSWGLERGAVMIQLSIDESKSDALAFYKKIGFKLKQLNGLCLNLIDEDKKQYSA